MKKKSILSIVIVSAIMLSGLILSCVDTANKSSKNVMSEEEIALEELNAEIQAVNLEFFGTSDLNIIDTRARIPFWLRCLSMLVSDVVFSCAGGPVVGAGASTVTGILIGLEDPTLFSVGGGSAIDVNASMPAYITAMATSSTPGEDMGYWHNKLIIDAYNELPNGFDGLTTNEVFGVIGEAASDNGIQAYVPYSTISLIENTIPQFIEAVELWGAIPEGISPCSTCMPYYIELAKEIVPNRDYEWQIISSYFDGLVQAKANGSYQLQVYYSTAITAIKKNKSISQSSKEFIIKAMSVATGSAELWVIPE